MTQAMLPAQPTSSGLENSRGVAKKSESQDDFSDTFRGQIEGESNDASRTDGATPGSSDGTASSSGQPAPGRSDHAAAQIDGTSVTAHAEDVANERLHMPLTAQENISDEGAAEQAPPIAVPVPSDGVQQALATAGSQSSGAVVAHVVLPAQFTQSLRGAPGETAGVVNPARVSGDRAGPTSALSSAVAGRSAAQGEQADSGSRADPGKLLHSVARVPELATLAPAHLAATATPALAAAPATAQGIFQSPSSAALPLVVDTPLSSPNWGHAVAARLVWGAAQGMQSASIEINPRELGPVSVNLRVTGEEASITFVSQHALVREAVEAALPRLRELFSGDGINLGEVDISNGGGQPGGDDRTASKQDSQSLATVDAQTDSSTSLSSHDVHPNRLDSLVDTFA